MMNVNKVIYAGRIGQKKTAATPEGMAITNLRVASTKTYYKDKQKQEKTTWMTVVAFGKQAEIIDQYLNVGDPIYVEGALVERSWQDKEGKNRKSVEIHTKEFQFVSVKKDETANSDDMPAMEAMDEAIPF